MGNAERSHNEVPRPEAIAAAKARLAAVNNLVFELELGSWRSVWLTEAKPFPVSGNQRLTVIMFKPVLLVTTPYLHDLDFWVAISQGSLDNKYCSMLHPDVRHDGARLGFRCANDEAEKWLRLKLAQAAGMRFREHNSVKSDELVYTK